MSVCVTIVFFGLASLHPPLESLENIPIAVTTRLSTESTYEAHHLSGDYGFFINRLDNKQPQIYVYEKKPAKIGSYASVDDFLAWLAGLPEGARVDQIRTCGSTRAGMPQRASERLDKIINEKKFHLTDETDGNFIICVCKVAEFRMFTTVDEAKAWISENADK